MMKMLHEDKKYFSDFARRAREEQARLEDYYILIQRDHRNEKGGATTLRPTELYGLTLARAHIQPEESCLILGCGCGVEAGWLLAHGIKNVSGLDVSEGVLATCEKTLGIKTIRGDMRKTGLPDRSYDVVLTHRSLHHLFYPFQGLEEFARIARRKVMILDEPVRSWLKIAIRRLRKERVISAANIYEYQFVREDVHRYMAFNGFDLAATLRYWETMKGPLTNCMLNAFGRCVGNRFSAIYRRSDAV